LCSLPTAQAVPDDGVAVTETAFTSDRERGVPRARSSEEVRCQAQEEQDEEWQDERRRMGVGKNTTSKSIEGGGDGGTKYEEETKHGADVYPIPVCA